MSLVLWKISGRSAFYWIGWFEILNGDLRPLYLFHLALAGDDNHDPEEMYEAPVPAGLDNLSSAQLALAELYGLSDALIAAAAAFGLLARVEPG